MNKKTESILLLIILLIAACLRFWQLGTNPASLYWDEAAIVLDAYSISQTGRDINNHSWFQPVLGSYGDFKAPVLIWLSSLTAYFFGMHPLTVRLPVALFSVLTVYLVYIVVRKMLFFDPRLANHYAKLPLLSALIVSISPWSVHFGRIGFESSLSVAFLLLTMIVFLEFLQRQKNIYLFLTAPLAALAVYTYYSLRLILPLLAVALLVIFYQQLKRHLLKVFITGGAFLLLLIPMLTSPYYQRSQEYRLNNNNLIHHQQVIAESSRYLERYDSNVFSRLVYHRYLLVARDFLVNWSSHFDLDFLFFRGDTNLRQHSGYFGQFLLIFLPFYGIGMYLLFTHFRSHLSKLLGVLLLLAPIPAAMVYEVPHASRAIYLFVPFAIIIAWGIHEFSHWSKRWLLAMLSLAVLVNAGFFYADYFIEYPKRSSEAWLYSYNQVAAYVRAHYREFSQIDIDERYWFPRIFIYYQFPELLDQTRDLKNAFLNSPVNSFGLPDPFSYLLDPNQRKQAKFIYHESEIPPGYVQTASFPFLSGEPSLILVTKETPDE